MSDISDAYETLAPHEQDIIDVLKQMVGNNTGAFTRLLWIISQAAEAEDADIGRCLKGVAFAMAAGFGKKLVAVIEGVCKCEALISKYQRSVPDGARDILEKMVYDDWTPEQAEAEEMARAAFEEYQNFSLSEQEIRSRLSETEKGRDMMEMRKRSRGLSEQVIDKYDNPEKVEATRNRGIYSTHAK